VNVGVSVVRCFSISVEDVHQRYTELLNYRAQMDTLAPGQMVESKLG
jgi:hypothetical protein